MLLHPSECKLPVLSYVDQLMVTFFRRALYMLPVKCKGYWPFAIRPTELLHGLRIKAQHVARTSESIKHNSEQDSIVLFSTGRVCHEDCFAGRVALWAVPTCCSPGMEVDLI